MRKLSVTTAVLAMVLAHGAASAQGEDEAFPCFVENPVSLQQAFGAADKEGSAPSVIGDSVSFAFAPDLTDRGLGPKLLAGGEVDGEATGEKETAGGGFDLRIETTSSDSRAGLVFNDTRSRGGDLRVFSAELSAPASDDGESEITRLGDINTDLGLKLSYTWFAPGIKPVVDSEALTKIQVDLLKACEAKGAAECKGTNSPNNAVAASHCVEKYLGKDRLNGFYQVIIKSRFAPFFGISGQVGRKSFKFLDTTTGLDAKDRQSTWAVEVFGGVVSPDRHHFWRAGYQHAEDYEDQDKRTICQPPGTGGFQECRSAPFGAPEEKKKELGVLEYRWLPSDEGNLVKGVQARLTFDFENDEYEFDVPVYMFKSGDGDLNGGIRAGVSSENDGYIAVFVGKKFGLY